MPVVDLLLESDLANSNSISQSSGYSSNDNGVDYRKLKLRFEVKILYALK